MMEVFAGFTQQTDEEMGRLLDVVRSLPDADNTLIFYIAGDNGASAEGGLVGLVNENSFFNNVDEKLEDNLKVIDELGGPKHFNHFPAGWAWAMNTPFQWTKQIASHLGGVRNPMAISWPKVIKDKGGVRSQFSHVIDIVPTVYEAVGIEAPLSYNGVAQRPVEGSSLVYSFADAAAKERHRKQYFEMLVNRGIYADGWWAASRTNIPWEGAAAEIDPDTVRWELYHLDKDFTQAVDLASKEPLRLKQLQELWWAEAARYNVLPLDGRKIVRMSAELQGRTSVTQGKKHFVYYPGVEALPSGSAPNLLNKSFSITAKITQGSEKDEGAVFTMGGSDGGYCLYVKDGKAVFASNFLGQSVTRAISSVRLPKGPSTVVASFDYDGGGLGKGGNVTLTVNGKKVGEARVERTVAITLGLGGTLDIGVDTGTAVDSAYDPPFKYSGTIERVDIDLK
jgi:hypothetical protein